MSSAYRRMMKDKFNAYNPRPVKSILSTMTIEQLCDAHDTCIDCGYHYAAAKFAAELSNRPGYVPYVDTCEQTECDSNAPF